MSCYSRVFERVTACTCFASRTHAALPVANPTSNGFAGGPQSMVVHEGWHTAAALIKGQRRFCARTWASLKGAASAQCSVHYTDSFVCTRDGSMRGQWVLGKIVTQHACAEGAVTLIENEHSTAVLRSCDRNNHVRPHSHISTLVPLHHRQPMPPLFVCIRRFQKWSRVIGSHLPTTSALFTVHQRSGERCIECRDAPFHMSISFLLCATWTPLQAFGCADATRRHIARGNW